MIPKYTKDEQRQLDELAEQFNDMLLEKQDEIDTLEASGDKDSERYKTVLDEWLKIENAFLSARRELVDRFEDYRFAEIKDDPDKVFDDARSQSTTLINNRYKSYKRIITNQSDEGGKKISGFNGADLRVDGLQIWLDADTITKAIRQTLRRHYDSFKDDPDRLLELDKIVSEAVSESKYVSATRGILGGTVTFDNVDSVLVTYPLTLIDTLDKVSNELFKGGFDSDPTPIEVIHAKGKQPAIYTLVSIDRSALDDSKISGLKDLSEFEQEVLNRIISFQEAGTYFVTTNMIYQALTGKKDAHCSKVMAQKINDATTRLMYIPIRIDASEEAKVDTRIKNPVFDAPAINAKRVTVNVNGKMVEGIKLLDTSIIRDYAMQKNQIGRYDFKLLNTDNNKNEETLILEGMLRRRILAIKSGSLRNKILYDPFYDRLGIAQKMKNDQSLRNKQSSIRQTIKTALDHYKKVGFIKDYTENIEKKKVVSVTIRY